MSGRYRPTGREFGKRRRGKVKKGSPAERAAFARAVWERDPNVSLNGRDGMNPRLKRKFDCTLPDQILMEIRAEVRAKAKKRAQTETKPELSAVPTAFAALASTPAADSVPSAPESLKPPTPTNDVRPAPPLPAPRRIVATPKPEPELETEVEPEHKGQIDMVRKADFDVKLGSQRGSKGLAERKRYITALLKKKREITNVEIDERVEKIFGMAAGSGPISDVRKKLKIFPAKSVTGTKYKEKTAKAILRKEPTITTEALNARIVKEYGHGMSSRTIARCRVATKTTRADRRNKAKRATAKPAKNDRSQAAVRSAYAEKLLLATDGITNEEIDKRLNAKFGRSIGKSTLSALRKKLGLGFKKRRGVGGRKPKAKTVPPAKRNGHNPEASDKSAVIAAMELLLEAVPGLYELKLSISYDDETGEVANRELDFKIDSGGSITF